MKPLRFLLSLALLSAVPFYLQPSLAQNITDLAVMADRSATTADLDDWTEGPVIADSVFRHPDRIRYDNRCLQIEGKDVFLLSGTFHYFRTPEPLWSDRMEKIRAAGFNCVETYVPWNWHEREMPASVDDFSKVDLGELERFLTLAEELGLYVIVRPGPYICAEWSGGGFPQWIMQKRPAQTKHEIWLQSDDPVFMAWNEHWYKAVARVTEPHQIYHRQPGTGGVILWQLENEFNRVKWIPSKCKRAYLEELARISRRCGIEVPFITCWTDQARNVKEGPLNGVIDMVNSYPRWQIRKGFGRLINQQLKSQGGKPLISGELQGGWSSDLGTPLSWDMDGQTPAQTQNITLYALQRGFCALNFYMLVGGTNFEDWAARNQTASYDFAAAIGEDGSLNERYYRFKSLAELIREHGTRIARSRIERVQYHTTDSAVELTVRRHPDGTRYLFVRTEEHTSPHRGELRIKNEELKVNNEELTIDFDLEPFGSQVYLIKSGTTTPIALVKEVEHTGKPQPHQVVQTLTPHLQQPKSSSRIHFTPLTYREGQGGGSQTVDDLGHYRRYPILYKVEKLPPPLREGLGVDLGGTLTIERVGKNQMNRTEADVVLAFADNKPLPIIAETDTTVSFSVPLDTKTLTFLYDSRGLHHHTNKAVEQHWHIGPRHVTLDGQPVRLAFTKADSSLLTFRSSLQAQGTAPLWLRLRHTGNGFVYLNGHCLGRCYEHGPQKEYYLPKCWLNTDSPNTIVITLLPSAKGAEIQEMNIVSISQPFSNAQWITSDVTEAVPYFARDFVAKKRVKTATLRASALGVMTIRLNGVPVSENRLEPGESQWDKTVLYCTYDVTPLIKKGLNLLLAKLGDGLFHVTPIEGRYSKPEIKNNGTPALLAELIIEYIGGQTDTLVTDASWRTAPSPTLRSNWWGGEDFDARRQMENVKCQMDNWHPAKVITPVTNLPIEQGRMNTIGQLRPQEHEPIQVVERWEAVSVTPLTNGDYVVDFGQNFAGVFQFTLKGKRGQTIRLQTSEQLNPDGTVNAQDCYCGPIVVYDTYTFGHDGTETWGPELMYHGFRYMQVSGLTEEPRPGQFKALRMRVSCDAVGHFETGNPLINSIHRICRNSIESQLFHVFTDCPQREKMGWLDVPNQMYNSIALNFDFRRLCHKIVRDGFDAQAFYEGAKRGKVPSTVPHFFTDWDDDPNWGGAAILVPYRTWKTYGDRSLLEQYYPQMKLLIDYYTSLTRDDLMPGDEYSRLSDWGQESSGLQHKTESAFTITCTYYYLLKVMAEMAHETGREADAATFEQQAAKTRSAFNARFYNDSTATYAHGNQAEMAMPLYYGLSEDAAAQRIADRLAEKVIADGYKVKTGECGLKPVLMMLAAYGHNDIVWQMACQTDYPSYGYFVENGCTTTPELWDMRYSQNHCMLDHIEEWFYTHLAGIQNEGVGYDNIRLQPFVPADLPSLSASVETPRGTIRSAYQRKVNDIIDFQFTVPQGTTATILLPDGSSHRVHEGHYRYQSTDMAP